MLNATTLLANELGQNLSGVFLRTFGGSDPLYPRKLNALYHEFAETGVNTKLGYASPADVAERYPRFFWSKVEPYIGAAVRHLELTMEGRQWVAQLYSNVFAIEHHRQHMGPQLLRKPS